MLLDLVNMPHRTFFKVNYSLNTLRSSLTSHLLELCRVLSLSDKLWLLSPDSDSLTCPKSPGHGPRDYDTQPCPSYHSS